MGRQDSAAGVGWWREMACEGEGVRRWRAGAECVTKDAHVEAQLLFKQENIAPPTIFK